MKRWRDLLWGAAADVLVVLVTVACAVPALLAAVITKRTTLLDAVAPVWARIALKICGVRLHVEGLENIDPTQSYVIISNHLSNADVWATLVALPLKLRFVAKQELTRLPFFGAALKRSEHVVIDRANPEESIERINQRVAKRGREPFCILFYAEGTRSPDGRIHTFKKGGVSLAIRTGLPVLPLTVNGTWGILPKNALLIRPGRRVKVVVDKPIATTAYSLEQRDELNDRVRQVICGNFDADYQ
jgi:1-acyl-sn-glycerol-3-phosphate acyltransferase